MKVPAVPCHLFAEGIVELRTLCRFEYGVDKASRMVVTVLKWESKWL